MNADMSIEHRALRGRMFGLLEELHRTDVLSEQQCAQYMGVDLLTWRHMRWPGATKGEIATWSGEAQSMDDQTHE